MKIMLGKYQAFIASLLAIAVLTIGINRPLTGQHDWNSVVYADIGRIIMRHGLDYARLGDYFFHYPPLLSLSVALSFTLFGVSDWAVRIVPILSAGLLVYCIFKLARELWDENTALLASVFVTFSPILLYYSKIPVHETVSLGFIALAIWRYLLWLKTRKSREYTLLVLSLILAQLSSWAGFYLSAYIPLHALIFAGKETFKSHRLHLVFLFLLAPILFSLHILHLTFMGSPTAFKSMFGVFLLRLNQGETAALYSFTYGRFFSLQARWMAIYFTRIMLILSLAWVGSFMVNRFQKRPISLGQNFIILLFFFGFTHNVVFRNLAFIHDYMLIYALPFFAVSSAASLNRLVRFLGPKKRVASLVTIVILVLFLIERLPYLKALFRTAQTNNRAYVLGLTIKELTHTEDTILILSPQFMEFNDVFIRFFADRKIAQAGKLDEMNIADFDYLVIPQSHDYVSSSDKSYLLSHYPYVIQGGGTIFNLQPTP